MLLSAWWVKGSILIALAICGAISLVFASLLSGLVKVLVGRPLRTSITSR